MLTSFIKQEFRRDALSSWRRCGAALLNRLKHRVDHRRYNGAALLGPARLVFKSHGSADACLRAGAQPCPRRGPQRSARSRRPADPGDAGGDAGRCRRQREGRGRRDRDRSRRRGRPTGARRRSIRMSRRAAPKANAAARGAEASMTAAPAVSRASPGPGSFLPPGRVSNAQLAERLAADGIETSDEWDRRAHRHPFAISPMPGHLHRDLGPRPRGVPSPPRTATRGRSTSSSSRLDAGHGVPVGRLHGPGEARHPRLRRVRRPGRVLGLRLRLSVADAMIKTGSASKALVIGSEVFSASSISRTEAPASVRRRRRRRRPRGERIARILASELHADGRHVGILCVPGTVSGGRCSATRCEDGGPAVFKLPSRCSTRSPARCWPRRPHRGRHRLADPAPGQIRIMQSTAKKLKLAPEKLIVTVDRHGNTLGASIPLALDDCRAFGQDQRGDTVMLEGVGGGFTWGATLSISRPRAAAPKRARAETSHVRHETFAFVSPARARRPWACSTPGATTRRRQTLEEASTALGEDIGR